MFTDKFLLSDEPMNGDWKIKVVTEVITLLINNIVYMVLSSYLSVYIN